MLLNISIKNGVMIERPELFIDNFIFM
jgi:hypothetical protein